MDASVAERLADYLTLVARWGRRLNLTGRPDAKTLLARQLPDALVLARVLGEIDPSPATVVDVGAGAGLVGIPLLVMRPSLSLTLVEASQRKCAFLRAALHELGLGASVHAARLEELTLGPFNLALARATFAPLDWVRIGAPLLATGGLLVCFLARESPPTDAGLPLQRMEDYQIVDGSPRRLALLVREGS